MHWDAKYAVKLKNRRTTLTWYDKSGGITRSAKNMKPQKT